MSAADGPGMVDWDFAVRLGARVAGDGPDVDAHDAAAAVSELREGARRSTVLVREFTGLVAEDTGGLPDGTAISWGVGLP